MKLDNIEFNLDDIVQSIENAPIEEKSSAIAKAIQSAMNSQKEMTVAEYRAMADEVNSNQEAAQKFGLRTLNKEEKEFYQEASKGFYDGQKRDLVLPTTTLNFVFEDLKKSRPLFQHIDWTPAGLEKWIFGEDTGAAQWGDLEDTITKEIKAALTTADLGVNKLSAFAFIPLGIIDLGEAWVDKYVREALIEANAEGLEVGIVDGDGKNAPVGITRKLTGAVDGVHSRRDAVKIDSFTPSGLAEVLAGLTNDGKRAVTEILLIVNPLDDFKLVKPASMFLNAVGQYSTTFPIPTTVIQSAGVPENHAVVMLPKAYQAGIKEMGLYASDDYKFLDHARTYKVVTYGNGRIKQENMAAYLDISDLKPLTFNTKQEVEGA